jgi:hypothetical protein
MICNIRLICGSDKIRENKNMTKKILIYIIIIIALMASLPLFSQGGSNYSIFGIGDIIYGNTASSQAMGGTQIGFPSNNSINIFNTALWSKIKTTRVQTGYRFNQNVINNSETTLLQNNGAMNGFYSIFNFDTIREISAGLMFQPLSSVNYYISSNIDPNDNGSLGLNGTKSYRGSGGLSNISLGLGMKIINRLYLGASVAATIGKIEHTSMTNITNQYTINSRINNISVVRGFNSNIGIYANLLDGLGIGAFYNIVPKGNIEERNEYLYESASAINKDTVIINEKKIALPSFWGVGVSYSFSKLLFAVDYLNGNFKDLSIYNSITFNNSSKISLGVALLGSQNQYSSLIDRISYKLGFYSEQLYYNVNGKQITENGITGGFQFPISRTAQIDFSLVVGRRGSLDNGLLQETFGKMIIDISIGDNWFKPIKAEY